MRIEYDWGEEERSLSAPKESTSNLRHIYGLNIVFYGRIIELKINKSQ